jgi:GNAT superfamily N-acetyltransferase
MSLEIASLREEHLEEAAKLVSASYQALRGQIPVLPVRYQGRDAVLDLLRDLYGEAEGVIAVQDGVMVGFLMGLVIPEFMGKRSAYSPVGANTAVPGQSRRIYEEMYACLSERWVTDGCITHVVSLMAHDLQALKAWSWLGFGLVNVDGLRPLTPLVSRQAKVEVRRASYQDAGVLSKLGRALEQHEASAPTFWLHELDDFGENLGEPGYAAWLAVEGGLELGFLAMEPGDDCECALLRDAKTVNISGAFTIEAARCKGVATSLLDQALAWARSQGYERCAVDFESMNTLAARFWLRWFEPVSYSLMRSIDERSPTYRSFSQG